MSDFVILGNGTYLKYVLDDILGSSGGVRYIDFESDKTKLNPLFEWLTLSQKIPDICKYWLWKYSQTIFTYSKADKIFIIYERNRYAHSKIFLQYLRATYPNSKFVYFFTNFVTKDWLKINARHFEFVRNTDLYDLKITFNKSDADRYGFEYHEHINTFHKATADGRKEKFDVFFCGRDKNRSSKIAEVYKKLMAGGFRCDFRIIDDTGRFENKVEGIQYYKRAIPYSEIIKGIHNSKCILDIANDSNEKGQSLRLSEAIAYEKLLLTDNVSVTESELYNPNQIVLFLEANLINTEEIKRKTKEKNYSNPEEVSPKKLLIFIEEKLNDR